jgi:hypothetical protein
MITLKLTLTLNYNKLKVGLNSITCDTTAGLVTIQITYFRRTIYEQHYAVHQ